MPQQAGVEEFYLSTTRRLNDDDGPTDAADEELTALVTRGDYPRDVKGADQTLRRFTVFSFLFAANPSAALACLALATARLGKIGAWSSGLLYFTYTMSSVTGATLVVKQLGGRNAMIVGMSMYCCYVGCFWIAVTFPSIATASALGGAAVGGIGAGILWTAQGSYFTQTAEDHALHLGCEWADCTSSLSGTFAFAYLLEETILHVSSYFLLHWGVPWTTIFALYFALAVLSTASMAFVRNFPPSREREGDDAFASQWYKATAALNLLFRDKKMPYLMGLNAAFGFSGAFINSFVSGEVLQVAMNDTESRTVGLFVSWAAGVAAVASLGFGKFTHDHGKAPVMIFGNAMFICVALPFVVQPDLASWTWPLLLLIYTCQGLGRATFESTVKATFADLFPYEKVHSFQ
jgi:MFS family permease